MCQFIIDWFSVQGQIKYKQKKLKQNSGDFDIWVLACETKHIFNTGRNFRTKTQWYKTWRSWSFKMMRLYELINQIITLEFTNISIGKHPKMYDERIQTLTDTHISYVSWNILCRPSSVIYMLGSSPTIITINSYIIFTVMVLSLLPWGKINQSQSRLWVWLWVIKQKGFAVLTSLNWVVMCTFNQLSYQNCDVIPGEVWSVSQWWHYFKDIYVFVIQ